VKEAIRRIPEICFIAANANRVYVNLIGYLIKIYTGGTPRRYIPKRGSINGLGTIPIVARHRGSIRFSTPAGDRTRKILWCIPRFLHCFSKGSCGSSVGFAPWPGLHSILCTHVPVYWQYAISYLIMRIGSSMSYLSAWGRGQEAACWLYDYSIRGALPPGRPSFAVRTRKGMGYQIMGLAPPKFNEVEDLDQSHAIRHHLACFRLMTSLYTGRALPERVSSGKSKPAALWTRSSQAGR